MKPSKTLNRRGFFQSLSILSAGAIAAPLVFPGRALGLDGQPAPSNRLTMGGVGLFNRGTTDLKTFLKHSDVVFKAICDVQSRRREAIKEIADKQNGDAACDTYIDMREMFARDDIDFVLIATGNRWHTLASIWAAQAGKDIYCEKPVSMTIQEARALKAAINQYDVVFQAGTQRRNSDNYQFATGLAHSGKLGKLVEVHANILWPGTRMDWYPGEPQPDSRVCDWDRWLGPCPWRPFNQRYVNAAGWYRIDDFEGEMPGWASHTIDMCQWAAQKDDEVPVEWTPQFDENGKQKWDIHGQYADGLKLIMRPSGFMGLGTCSIRLVGDEGWVETGDSCRVAVSSDALREGMTAFKDGMYEGKHVAEFLDCVRTRKKTTSNVDVTVNSHIACHASSICWKLGKKIRFDLATDTFDCREANGLKARAMREPYTLN